jgi:hypothetical protein
MVNQEIIDRIYKLRGTGQTDEQILSGLLSFGFKKEEIEANLSFVGEQQKNFTDILYKTPVPAPPPAPLSQKHFRNNVIILFCFIAALAGGIWFFKARSEKLECRYEEMTFYYSPTCPVCQRVLNEKSVEKLEKGGTKITKYDIGKGELPQEIYERGSMPVPTFVIDSEEYSGYYSYGSLKSLLGCK